MYSHALVDHNKKTYDNMKEVMIDSDGGFVLVSLACSSIMQHYICKMVVVGMKMASKTTTTTA